MAELPETLASLQLGPQIERCLQLVVVASTLMQNNHECVIAWSVQEQGLIRPITNLVTNSWIFGTFKVGQVYWFVILDSNPSNAIWPHKSEDTIVQINPVPVSTVSAPRVPVQYTESEMYNMLFGSSVKSVFSLFAPGVIKGRNVLQLGFFNAIWEISWCSKIRLTCLRRDVGSRFRIKCLSSLWQHRTKMPY